MMISGRKTVWVGWSDVVTIAINFEVRYKRSMTFEIPDKDNGK